jgi:hypothetical protein
LSSRRNVRIKFLLCGSIEKAMNEERMLKWFEYAHLPEHLQAVSRPFGELAAKVCEVIEGGPERTVALRKLLESKDAAVRAKLNPGG